MLLTIQVGLVDCTVCTVMHGYLLLAASLRVGCCVIILMAPLY